MSGCLRSLKEAGGSSPVSSPLNEMVLLVMGDVCVLRDIMQMEVSILHVLHRWPVLNTLVKNKD